MWRIVMLLLLSSSMALSGCSCARRHELPLKRGMSMDEVESILAANGYFALSSQWYSYSNEQQGYSGAIAVHRPTKRSRRFVVIDWRGVFSDEGSDGSEARAFQGFVLHRFAYGVSKEPYVSTPLQELDELLDAQETASEDKD